MIKNQCIVQNFQTKFKVEQKCLKAEKQTSLKIALRYLVQVHLAFFF